MDDDPLESVLLLNTDQYIEDIACGALFTVALSNKGRIFACGFQGVNSTSQTAEQFFDKAKFRLIAI